MIDPSTSAKPSPPALPAPAKTGKSANHTGALALVALLAFAALGVAGWQMQNTRTELDGLRQELAKRLADVDTQTKAGRVTDDQLREATREASVKIGVLESKLAESQSQQIALEALYQDLSRNRDEWAFAEIEQTLLMASQQLQLAGNVKAALIALQATDTRLQAMNRAQHAALRAAIARDVTRLKAAPLMDTVGLSVRIDTLVAAVDKLPLAAETRPAAATEAAAPAAEAGASTAARFWREVWTDLKQLVRVQRIDRADVPLLAPAQTFFLRENLKLRLLTARMALLTRDQATFRNDLKAAREWLARYFDARDKSVASAVATLAGLQSADINIELPDITATLEAMRAVAQTRARGK
ncbi:MAG: uroporphyrinogen-III C-methyltransferase [Burkholderiales bacterium]